MADALRVDWRPGTPFLLLIQGLTARMSRRWRHDDPLEALFDVYKGLRHTFVDGEVVERGSGLIWTIVFRRVTNYYKSRDKRGPCQLRRHSFDDPITQYLDTDVDTPLDEAANRELREVVDGALSAMPPHRAEAVRSRLGYPGSPNPSDLARRWGTTRQNVHKHADKGLAELRYVTEKFLPRLSPPATPSEEA